MSIDEAINGVEKRILPIYDNDADHKALIIALDTMRKYQKIEQVLNVWKEMRYNENDGLYMLISGVVKDGNVD